MMSYYTAAPGQQQQQYAMPIQQQQQQPLYSYPMMQQQAYAAGAPPPAGHFQHIQQQQQPGRVSPVVQPSPHLHEIHAPSPVVHAAPAVHAAPVAHAAPAVHAEPGRTSPVPMSAPPSQVQMNAIATLKQRIAPEAAIYPPDVFAYCTDACLSRYLRARDWDVEAAYRMLKGSLDWRASFKPHLITEAQIQGPLKIGTMFFSGFDRLNRPIVYVKPGAQSPNTIEERLMYVAWLMEHVASLMGDGVEQVMIIMDFSEFGKRAKSPDSRQTAQAVINILQNHYPERLGAAIVINSPWYFNLLFKMMSPFINANTKKKMSWITGDHQQIYQILCQSVEPEQLLTIYGGKNGNFPAGEAHH